MIAADTSRDGDRAILELAAKAHGFVDDAVSNDATFGLHRSIAGDFYWIDSNGWTPWVPRDDDGQALRLAVKLCISPAWHPSLGHATAYGPSGASRTDEYGSDGCAATRRAIVRCAAEIGRASIATSARSETMGVA